jgi:mono/diheme cytochrome c family protein
MIDITALIRRASPAIVVAVTIAAFVVMRPSTPEAEPMRRGEQVYREYCARCHGDSGEGIDGVRRISDINLWDGPVDSVIVTLAYGATASHDASAKDSRRRTMPPIPYGDDDIAAVTAYLYETFKGRPITVGANDVRTVKQRYRSMMIGRMQR